MKVLIALVSSSMQLSGVQRHAINLARCLLTCSSITRVYLVVAHWQLKFVSELVPPDERLHIHSVNISSDVLSRNWWFYSQLPQLAESLAVDVVHVAYPMPIKKAAFACPVVVTLHDLYPYDVPENFGFPRVWFNRVILRQCLQSVDAIACVSRSTKSRLEELMPVLATEKSVVIYNAVEVSSSAEGISPEWGTQPFLLCVAQHRRNKNILLVLSVFEKLLQSGRIPTDSRLLIIGIPGPETPAIIERIRAAKLNNAVALLKGISDANLQWCYENAKLLFAPSIIEGFGLPVAEALLAGCRVICSDIPAFRELGGQHSFYVVLGPDAEREFAEVIARVVHLPPAEPILMPHLSTSAIGEQYVRLYGSLLDKPRPRARFISTSFFKAPESEALL